MAQFEKLGLSTCIVIVGCFVMADEKPYRDAPAKYKSRVWGHFGFSKLDVKKVICKHCLAEIKYQGGTTNMSTHLSRHHKITEVGSKSGKYKNLFFEVFFFIK